MKKEISIKLTLTPQQAILIGDCIDEHCCVHIEDAEERDILENIMEQIQNKLHAAGFTDGGF